jgi:hypothetical protein
MEPLHPIDARSIPATLSHIAGVTPLIAEARFIGPPPDLDHPLPSIKLERLWLQNMKPDVAAWLSTHFDPKQLWLRNVQTADLGWIGGLRRLEDLLIDWNTKLESFEFLKDVRPLRRLRADGLKRTNRLDGLVHQPTLESLWIGGGIDRRLHLASIAPLASLRKLEQLFLICVQLEDASLAPLAALTRLKRLRMQTNMAPMEEYARLAGALPNVESDALRGFKTLRRTLPPGSDLLEVIDQLADDEQIIIVGKGGRRFKVSTDRQKIVEHLVRFRAVRDSVAPAKHS